MFIYHFQSSLQAEKPYSPTTVLNSKGHQGLLHIAMPIPLVHCTISKSFTYQLFLRGSYVNTVTIAEAVIGSSPTAYSSH